MSKQVPASISIDLDNQWSYMKTHGDDGWEQWPSYLNRVVPRFLDFFETKKTSITVFIVGQDADKPEHHDVLRNIAAADHEIGNHSFHHEPWLHLYSSSQLHEEFERSESAIFEATGQRPRGFRGPGFSFSDEVLNILAARNYVYDASTFPTYLGPLARAYYFFTSQLDRNEKEDRKQLFGKFSEGLRPIKPFNWQIGKQTLTEIPVTTMPIFKTPVHASYLFYLATFSQSLARIYLKMTFQLCRLTGTGPSFLLHPLDFMDQHDVPELAYFPGMKLDASKKLELLSECLERMQRDWTLGTMMQHAELAKAGGLKTRSVTTTTGSRTT